MFTFHLFQTHVSLPQTVSSSCLDTFISFPKPSPPRISVSRWSSFENGPDFPQSWGAADLWFLLFARVLDIVRVGCVGSGLCDDPLESAGGLFLWAAVSPVLWRWFVQTPRVFPQALVPPPRLNLRESGWNVAGCLNVSRVLDVFALLIWLCEKDVWFTR